MKDNIKNLLGVSGVLSMLLLGFAAFNFAGAYSSAIEPTSFRSFTVSGEGEAVGIPDVAEFGFEVITQGGKDIASIQQENTSKANAVIDFVKSNGVDAKDIKTKNYDLSPRYQYYNCYGQDSAGKPCPPPEIVGYTITQSVAVKIRDFAKVGTILSGVVEKGANAVSQLTFKIDDPTSVQDAAREEAIKKAQAKAEAIARAGGFRLGRLLAIEEGSRYIPYYETYGRGGVVALDAAAEKVSIEPGSEEVNITVTLTYEIK